MIELIFCIVFGLIVGYIFFKIIDELPALWAMEAEIAEHNAKLQKQDAVVTVNVVVKR